MKLLLITCAVCALLFGVTEIGAEDMQDILVEQTTESPIADMALVDPKNDMAMNQKQQVEARPHTIADFIIHPLIALKPRQPEAEPKAEGKQADTSTTTPSPWQLFGFNPGQNLGLGLGSSVSNLAGQVTGWLGNRIQLPGLVDTPVRGSTSTSTTTTTTPRPDVVVRVQQRPSTRKPLIAINNENRPFRNKNPNRINNNLDESDEYDDEYDDDFEDDNDNRDHDDEDDSSNEDDDEDSDDNNEEHDDVEEEEEEEEPVKQQNNNRRRRPRPLNNNNSNNNNNRGNYNNNNNQRRRFPNNINNNQHNRNQNRRRPQQSNDIEQYDDDNDDYDQGNYYNNNNNNNNNNNQKRSQNQQNFIQRGQHSLLNQIRQFTRGQTPAEIGNAIRKPQNAANNKKRRQQATWIINRNGQTIYASPELLQAVEASNNNVKPNTNTQQFQFYQPASVNNQQTSRPVSSYPQPPLTIPYRRKGQPTQYITIPWSQLGISPPDQIISLTDGIQSQPLILNIPQSAVNAMQNQRPNKKKQLITSEAVPLLADASLMDIFKPPRIPPARTPAKVKPTKKPKNSGTPVVIASKTKPGPQRIRPGTIVEKAPAEDNEESMSSDLQNSETPQFIVVGEDGEAGLGRNAFPYYNSLVDYLQHNGGFRDGRQLNVAAETAKQQQGEQLIPVQVINAEETKVDNKVETVESPVEVKVESEENTMEAKVETVETSMEAKAKTTEEAKEEVAAETKVPDAKVETPAGTEVVAADVAMSPNSEKET